VRFLSLLRLHDFISDFVFLVRLGIFSCLPGKRNTLTIAVREIPVAAFPASVHKPCFFKRMYQVSYFLGMI